MDIIQGIPVAPGVVIARAFVLEKDVHRIPYRLLAEDERANELSRLETALERAGESISSDRDRAAEMLGPEPAKIFEFHLGLLRDPKLTEQLRQRVESDGVSADYAVAEAFGRLGDQFRQIGSEVFRDKARDMLDLERRVLGHLVGRSRDQLSQLEEPVILVAHEMTPAQAASLSSEQVVGVATDLGGRTDHTSIVAAALGLPVVVGCRSLTGSVNDGDLLVINGGSGEVIHNPDDETVERFRAGMAHLERLRPALKALSELEPVTLDGTHITLQGNIEFPEEVPPLLEYGGEGVGLYRTEFLYLTSVSEPTEDDLCEQYVKCLTMLDGAPLTIRTVDLGADKHTQERTLEPERNPFLGLRSIRYCLQNLPLFRTQLKAILRASAHGPLKIMFPLITTVTELKQAKMLLDDVKDECRENGTPFDENIPVGMMIEVPSAALMAPTFAREVDFFSIGTNDLIQYTVAVDRGNERVANLYTASNPAVIKLVKAVIRAARRGEIEVSLCGEIAGDLTYTMLLLGLGLRSLSLVPSQIPRVKQVIRAVDIETCEHLARKVGSFDSERRILMCLREELRKVLPAVGGGWPAE